MFFEEVEVAEPQDDSVELDTSALDQLEQDQEK